MSERNPNASDSDGISLPTWVTKYADFFKRLATNPRDTIVGFVVTWLVGGVLGFGEGFVGSISAVWDSLLGAGGILFDQALTLGSVLLSAPRLLLDVIDGTIMSIASSSGPFAPLVIVALWTVVVVGIATAARNVPRILWYAYQVIPGT